MAGRWLFASFRAAGLVDVGGKYLLLDRVLLARFAVPGLCAAH